MVFCAPSDCTSSFKSTTVKFLKRPLSKRPNIGFHDHLSLNAGQKYCRMLQGGHSAILSTFIRLPFVIKIFVLSILGGRFNTGITTPLITSFIINSSMFKLFVKKAKLAYVAVIRVFAILDGWLRMGLLPLPPPPGNFADIFYLVEN